MCQLLGMNCNTPTDVMFSFTGFAERGGRTDHHADGFGIAFFEDRGLRHFVDRHGRRRDSPVAAADQAATPSRAKTSSPTSARPPQGAVNAAELPPLRARAVGPLLGLRPQRRPEGLPPPPACGQFRPVGEHRQRARLLLAHAGAGQGPRRRAHRRRADPARCASCCRSIAAPRHLQRPAVQRPGAVGPCGTTHLCYGGARATPSPPPRWPTRT
jgi:hypothetical protein